MNGFGAFVLGDVVDRLFHVVIVRTQKIHDEVFVVMRFAVEEIVDLVQTIVQQIYIVTSEESKKPLSSSGISLPILIARKNKIAIRPTNRVLTRVH